MFLFYAKIKKKKQTNKKKEKKKTKTRRTRRTARSSLNCREPAHRAIIKRLTIISNPSRLNITDGFRFRNNRSNSTAAVEDKVRACVDEHAKREEEEEKRKKIHFFFYFEKYFPFSSLCTQVYIMLAQTDGLGLGAWNKPGDASSAIVCVCVCVCVCLLWVGKGRKNAEMCVHICVWLYSITSPGRNMTAYSWEVTLPDLEIQPALLQMFYEQASPNDYFLGALSGPG